MDIAIKIGTINTSIFLSGSGVVLCEPTIIAFNGDPHKGKVKAVGMAAQAMIGKTPEGTVLVSPVKDGVIVEQEACVLMMQEFMRKITPSGSIFRPRIKAIVGVPTGLSIEEQEIYEQVCAGAGVGNVTLVDNVMLAAIGEDMPVCSAVGGLIATIGGGVTEVAAISLGEVISGCSISIGGSLMDRAIVDYVTGKYNVRVGINTIRRTKEEIASLHPNDSSFVIVSGIDAHTKSPASCKLRAVDIRDVVLPYYMKICETIETILRSCPPDVAADIAYKGVVLTGNAARIAGLQDEFERRLGIPVIVPESTSYSVVVGGGKLISDKQMQSVIFG